MTQSTAAWRGGFGLVVATLALLALGPVHAEWELQIPLDEGRAPEPELVADDDAVDAEATDGLQGEGSSFVEPARVLEAEGVRPDVFERVAGDVVADPKPRPAAAPKPAKAPPAAVSPPGTRTDDPAAPAAGKPENEDPPLTESPQGDAQPTLATRLELPGATAADLRKHWAQRREHLRNLDPVQAQAEADAIVELKDRLAIRGLPSLAHAIVREGRRDLERSDAKDALAKAELALRLAPELPGPRLFRARARLAGDWMAVGPILGDLWGGARRAFGGFPAQRAVFANLILALLLGVLVAGLVFLALSLFTHLGLFLHDFHHLFPAGVVRLQTVVLALGLLATPFALRLGPALMVLVVAAAAWLYLGRAERAVVAGTLVLLSLLPPAFGSLAAYSAFWTTPAADVWLVERTGSWDAPVERLTLRAEAGEAQWSELFALARFHKREGRLAEAKALWTQAIEAAPRRPEAQNGLGVTLYALGDLAGAKLAFQSAIDLDPRLAAAYHNLAKIHFRGGNLGPGQESRRRAKELDPELVKAHPDEDTRLNHALADPPLSDEALLSLLSSEDSAKRTRDEVGLRLAGVMPVPAGPWLPAAGVALLALLGLVLGRARPSRACVKCGRAVCRRCDREVGSGQLCGQCVNVFQKQGAVPPQLRAQKELRIRRYAEWRERAARILGFAVPGAGQVALHRPLRGIALLALVLVGAAGLLLWLGPFPSLTTLGAGLEPWRLAVFGPMVVAAYALAVWDLLRGD